MKTKTTEQLEKQIRQLKRTNQAQQKEIKALEREKYVLEIETAELQRKCDALKRENEKSEGFLASTQKEYLEALNKKSRYGML